MDTPALVEVIVAEVRMNIASGNNTLMLREKDGSRVVPIFIGSVEGDAISISLQGAQIPRPMTHDLLFSMASAMGAQVQRIVINRWLEHTFYAEIVMAQGEQTFTIDARPSDAVALAVRSAAPVFVARTVFDATSIIEPDREIEPADQQEAHTLPVAELSRFYVPQAAEPRPVEWEGQAFVELRVVGLGKGGRLLLPAGEWAQLRDTTQQLGDDAAGEDETPAH